MLRYNKHILGKFAANMDVRVLAYNALYELYSGVITPIAHEGAVLPNTIYVETGSRCDGGCIDCYVPKEDRRDDIRLTGENLIEIVETAGRIGVNYITILGGEPFHESNADLNLRLIHDNPLMRFLVCTSARGLEDAEVMDELKKYVNFTPVFSFDGTERTNDIIRGKGSYSRSTRALKEFSESGKRMAGAIFTLRPENINEVTDPTFLESVCSNGCYFIEFGPYYTTEKMHKIAPSEYADAVYRLMQLSTDIPVIIFSNHFGQLFGTEIDLTNRLQSVNIDYRGNVYSARRGESFGNVNKRKLIDILYDENFQRLFNAKHVMLDAATVADTDSRYPLLFWQTLGELKQKGVTVKTPTHEHMPQPQLSHVTHPSL